MGLPLRLLFLALVFSFLPLSLAQSAPLLERGTAVIDPAALRELDRGAFGLARMLSASPSSNKPFTDDALFALPAIAGIRKSLDEEFERYVERHKAEFPNETIGVGPQFDFQLFDRDQLYSQSTRFVLSGIVNRMDRAYVAPDGCGEIRLIYRLTRTDLPETAGEGAVSPRLPMTLNVVLKAKGDLAIDGDGRAGRTRAGRR